MKDRNYLFNMYNATSAEHPNGSDEIETYEHWLERQLLIRMEHKNLNNPQVANADVKQMGLIHKYIITKTNGSPIDENAEYFVLRLDEGGSDPKHIAACREAIICYAKSIKDHIPKLSEELLNKYENLKK